MEMINICHTFKKEVNIAGTYNGVLNLNEKINEINLDRNGKPNKMNDDFKKLLSLKEVYKDKTLMYSIFMEIFKMAHIQMVVYLIVHQNL